MITYQVRADAIQETKLSEVMLCKKKVSAISCYRALSTRYSISATCMLGLGFHRITINHSRMVYKMPNAVIALILLFVFL